MVTLAAGAGGRADVEGGEEVELVVVGAAGLAVVVDVGGTGRVVVVGAEALRAGAVVWTGARVSGGASLDAGAPDVAAAVVPDRAPGPISRYKASAESTITRPMAKATSGPGMYRIRALRPFHQLSMPGQDGSG